ncbi:hypothetical protein COO60DRAFT_1460540 [Scenedesmus sp. NREL 46B-D3]|nr:hypothetical protein COO60DRAFT_1460540 [Scenedesmus sp. NREL 46B-D3]
MAATTPLICYMEQLLVWLPLTKLGMLQSRSCHVMQLVSMLPTVCASCSTTETKNCITAANCSRFSTGPSILLSAGKLGPCRSPYCFFLAAQHKSARHTGHIYVVQRSKYTRMHELQRVKLVCACMSLSDDCIEGAMELSVVAMVLLVPLVQLWMLMLLRLPPKARAG